MYRRVQLESLNTKNEIDGADGVGVGGGLSHPRVPEATSGR